MARPSSERAPGVFSPDGRWIAFTLTNNNPYAVSKDGERFLMPVALDPEGVGPITVVLNWMSRVVK